MKKITNKVKRIILEIASKKLKNEWFFKHTDFVFGSISVYGSAISVQYTYNNAVYGSVSMSVYDDQLRCFDLGEISN